jgi:hypothetical protein
MINHRQYYPREMDARMGQWSSPLGGRSRAAAIDLNAQPSIADRFMLGLALWIMLSMLALGVLAFRYLPQVLVVAAGLITVVLVSSRLY